MCLLQTLNIFLLVGENLQLHRMVFQRTMVLTMLPWNHHCHATYQQVNHQSDGFDSLHFLSFFFPPELGLVDSDFALCVNSSLFDLPYDFLDVLSVHQLCISMLTSFKVTSLTQETPPMQLVSSEQKRHSSFLLFGLCNWAFDNTLYHFDTWEILNWFSFSLHLQMFLSIGTGTKL